MSSGVIPSFLSKAGEFVSDILGSVSSGKGFGESLLSAGKHALQQAVGMPAAQSAQGAAMQNMHISNQLPVQVPTHAVNRMQPRSYEAPRALPGIRAADRALVAGERKGTLSDLDDWLGGRIGNITRTGQLVPFLEGWDSRDPDRRSRALEDWYYDMPEGLRHLFPDWRAVEDVLSGLTTKPDIARTLRHLASSRGVRGAAGALSSPGGFTGMPEAYRPHERPSRYEKEVEQFEEEEEDMPRRRVAPPRRRPRARAPAKARAPARRKEEVEFIEEEPRRRRAPAPRRKYSNVLGRR